MKKYQPGANMQVLFICPKCGRQLAWALPAAEMQCPKCYAGATADAMEKIEAVKKSLGI